METTSTDPTISSSTIPTETATQKKKKAIGLINHDMKITKDLADYNINEEVGKKYYKRISTEALNRTD